MNFLQVDKFLIPEARKRNQARLFTVGQSQRRYMEMLNGGGGDE